MAKDGTSRGGLRPGAGRKPKPLAEKIEAGNPGHRKLKMLEIPDLPEGNDMPEPTELPEGPDLEGVSMPKPAEYLSAQQRDGTTLGAAEIYTNTYRWLQRFGCEQIVSTHLIEQYAISIARWIQCEEAVSRWGLIGKHATTGAPTQSPYVVMSQNYSKQALNLWFQIFQIVKENCAVEVSGPNPNDDAMEKLLRARKG